MPTIKLFTDRFAAGRKLGQRLQEYAARAELLVLGLPRGGIPVAYEVAKALHAPLDCLVIRKLGVPGQEELAMGAIASGPVRVLNRAVMDALGIPQAAVEEVALREETELRRREREYRGDRPPPQVQGRCVIIVDDGLATGSTMQAAVTAVRQQRPAEVVVAVPVAPAEVCGEFRFLADHIVCVETPEPFYAVGLWYAHFEPTSDAEVRQLLARAHVEHEAMMEAPHGPA
jgi:putative phosphoribosyl transferase